MTPLGVALISYAAGEDCYYLWSKDRSVRVKLDKEVRLGVLVKASPVISDSEFLANVDCALGLVGEFEKSADAFCEHMNEAMRGQSVTIPAGLSREEKRRFIVASHLAGITKVVMDSNG